MRFTCECGESFHDDTNVIGMFWPFEDFDQSVVAEVHKLAVETWHGRKKPHDLAMDATSLIHSHGTRVFKCPSCGRISWFEEVDPTTEKHEYRVFKPEPSESLSPKGVA